MNHPGKSPIARLALALPLAASACVVHVEDDDDGVLNDDPVVEEVDAYCDNDLTYWTLLARVTDGDGDDDVYRVVVDIFEVYPNKDEDYIDDVDLFYEGDGWWGAEVDSEFGFLNCEFQYTYCFDFRAFDLFGGESDVVSYCN